MNITRLNSLTSQSTDLGGTRNGSKTLNQQDFLRLLVAQMTAQDPLNPQSNADFAAQMAQFTALETSQTTQAEIAQLRSDQQVAQANSLLGRSVTLDVGGGLLTTGVVSEIRLVAGRPQLLVNGTLFDPSQLVSIQPATKNAEA